MHGNLSNRLLPKPLMNSFVITVVHWPSCSVNVFDIVVVYFGSLLLLLLSLSARRCSRLVVVELTLLHVLSFSVT
jgi:lipoprotein signal peptidase